MRATIPDEKRIEIFRECLSTPPLPEDLRLDVELRFVLDGLAGRPMDPSWSVGKTVVPDNLSLFRSVLEKGIGFPVSRHVRDSITR